MNKPKYIREIGNKTYCILDGELDKAIYENQCSKCPIQNNCTKIKSIKKKVPDDWHGLNASALYGKDFDETPDPYKRKALRDISKIVGLALCYGGSAWTVCKNMKSTQEEAQKKIDNFFSKLQTLSRYMNKTKRDCLETGMTFNLFGRKRDVSNFAKSKNPDYKKRKQDIAFAERTALNNPIQSTAAEVLKIATIRVENYLTDQKWNPLGGLTVPTKIDFKNNSYKDILMSQCHSIHDESLYVVRDDKFDECIPESVKVMRLKDVTLAFGVDWCFEVDCEYDATRSWTAKKAYLPSEIFLRNTLSESNEVISKIVIDIDNVTNSLLSSLDQYNGVGDHILIVQNKNEEYIHDKKFNTQFIDNLNVPYQIM